MVLESNTPVGADPQDFHTRFSDVFELRSAVSRREADDALQNSAAKLRVGHHHIAGSKVSKLTMTVSRIKDLPERSLIQYGRALRYNTVGWLRRSSFRQTAAAWRSKPPANLCSLANLHNRSSLFANQ